jgi:hypothetical protein
MRSRGQGKDGPAAVGGWGPRNRAYAGVTSPPETPDGRHTGTRDRRSCWAGQPTPTDRLLLVIEEYRACLRPRPASRLGAPFGMPGAGPATPRRNWAPCWDARNEPSPHGRPGTMPRRRMSSTACRPCSASTATNSGDLGRDGDPGPHRGWPRGGRRRDVVGGHDTGCLRPVVGVAVRPSPFRR